MLNHLPPPCAPRRDNWLRQIGDLFCVAVLVIGFGLLNLTSRAQAESDFSIAGLSPEEAGLAIFREIERRDSGYQDLTVELEMVLRDSRGVENHRELKIQQLEMMEDGDRLMVLFDSPKPIRGTALLSYSYKFEPDDQWLYLPAIKRVKKIASQNRSGPFLSSEFAFEDLALQEVEKFSYQLIEEGSDASGDFYLVERTPVDKYSGYSRQRVRIDKPQLRLQFVEYFDRQKRPLKTLKIEDYALYLDQFWKPGLMVMSNLQNGKVTELFWRDYQFAVGLEADRDFSTNALLRVH